MLTLRGGYNQFDDNYNLNDRNGSPLNFNVSSLGWPTSLTSQMSDTQRFPSMTITGYKGSGWTTRQANGYYQYGANGTLSKLAGRHNVKMGGDYRVLGVTSLNYGASTGSFTFTGGYSGNALADLLLGYPQSTGNTPLNTNVDGYVRYYSGYVQDDWRVSNKLTINYGIRLERETGLDGAQQPDHGQFRPERGEPAQQPGEPHRPGHRAEAAAPGRPGVCGHQRRAHRAGQSAGSSSRAARGRRLQLRREDRAARRLGPLLLAVELPGGGHDRLGTDRLLRHDERAAAIVGDADDDDEQSIPERSAAADRQHAGTADRRGR